MREPQESRASLRPPVRTSPSRTSPARTPLRTSQPRATAHHHSRTASHTPSRAPSRALWGAIALAAGLYLAGNGALAWLLGAVVVAAGVAGLAGRRRWAPLTLWIGLGLCLGLMLHLAITLVTPESPGLLPIP